MPLPSPFPSSSTPTFTPLYPSISFKDDGFDEILCEFHLKFKFNLSGNILSWPSIFYIIAHNCIFMFNIMCLKYHWLLGGKFFEGENPTLLINVSLNACLDFAYTKKSAYTCIN